MINKPMIHTVLTVFRKENYQFAVLVAILLLSSCKHKQVPTVLESPDGAVRLVLDEQGGGVSFNEIFEQDTVLKLNHLGLVLKQQDFSQGLTVRKISSHTHNDTWQAVNGKNRDVKNSYNEYVLDIAKKTKGQLQYTIIFRVYDDGFAYKYKIKNENSNIPIDVIGENSQISFPKDFTYWAYNGEFANVGPNKRSTTKMDSIRTPMVIKTNGDKYIGVHEAEVEKYAPFDLRADGRGYSVRFQSVKASASSPLETSWRVFFAENAPGDLVNSNLLVNLNPASKIADTSWIKPGKSMWDWRVWGYKTENGFSYGLNTVSHKRLIDFASKNNIQYLLIDADWYGAEFSEDSDPTSARKGVNIEECMAYAKNKGVGVILYLNDKGAKRFGLERVLKQFADWGAVGVKYGFMKGTEAEKVLQTRKVVELCAKYKLMVDFHDNPIKPSGDRRTWPNLMTKEYGQAQADGHRVYTPSTMVSSAMINMIAGPIDYTNGWFDLNNAQSRNKVFEPIPGTVAAEVAKLIVVYTGLMVLPDAPEAYLKKDDLFDCIRKMPAQFDSFQVLQGEIGKYVAVARRAGNDWFVGALTNEEPRTLEIDFGFLPNGKKYKATFYEDAEDSDYLTNKESYEIESKEVDSDSRINIKLAPGGGQAIYLEAK